MDDFVEAKLIALLEVAERESPNPDGTLTEETKKLLADIARVQPSQQPEG